MSREAPTPPAVTLESADRGQMSKVEKLKSESAGLFFVAGKEKHAFADEIDALSRGDAKTLSNDAKEISKHFGIYKQQERAAGRKTGDYIFMVRLKLPAGGELAPEQWEALCAAAVRFGNGTLRLTTRQGVQFHYVSGPSLGPLVRFLNEEYPNRGYEMTTLGACGDVNRNTMCCPVDDLDAELPLDARALALEIAAELAPRSSAYYQIFLTDDEGRNLAPMNAEEPIYGEHYLPRKFKVGIAHPNDNSVDLLTQDVGLLPVPDGEGASDYDLYTGGGLGITHNQPTTKQLLGLYLGRIRREQVVDAVRSIAILQKENGERKDRRQARWKYTIRRLGVDRVRTQLRERFGIEIKETEPAPLPPIRYWLGWHREAAANGDGDRWFLGIPVENGRLGGRAFDALRALVAELGLGVRITPNQDLVLCHVSGADRARVDAALAAAGVRGEADVSRARRQGFACPALPTCGLAMTEAENVLPRYLDAIEEAGLGDVDIIIRMAGCPNSCSRPPTAEIGIYGYGKNDHVVQVGGARDGSRIGRVLYDRVPEGKMIPVLCGLLKAVRDHNPDGLPAGDFLAQTDADALRAHVGVEL